MPEGSVPNIFSLSGKVSAFLNFGTQNSTSVQYLQGIYTEKPPTKSTHVHESAVFTQVMQVCEDAAMMTAEALGQNTTLWNNSLDTESGDSNLLAAPCTSEMNYESIMGI
jgi:hypothetical protein